MSKSTSAVHETSTVLPVAVALLGLLIAGSYPAITKLTMVDGVQAFDLVALRLGVSGLVLAPFLYLKRASLSPKVWRASFLLAFLHGWGMVSLVLFGLQFAPSWHAGTLGPGTMPAWAALIGWLATKEKPSAPRLLAIAVILCCVALIVFQPSAASNKANALLGDACFVAAAACGASYLFLAKRWGVPALLGVALCAVLSLPVLVLGYFFLGSGQLLAIAPKQLLFQLIYQGLIVGVLSYFCVNFSANRLGPQRATIIFAANPVCAALCGNWLLGEPVDAVNAVCLAVITAAIVLGVARKS